MSVLLIGLVAIPLAAVIVSAFASHRVAQLATLFSGVACFVLALVLIPAAADHTVTAARYLRADALSVVFVLATTFLYAATAAYSIGYLAAEAKAAGTARERADFARYSRRFHLGMNLFAWSMICAPLANGLALLWVAVEITTVVSALLVALDDTEDATEAAWKYVLLASCGLGIALLATILMYAAGAQILGSSYDLAFDPLIAAAGRLPATPVRLAFLLAVVGFGTKVGLFPVHTWLPDAHAQAPTPVSALLSGSLLATSFYAILRYYQIAGRTLGWHFPQTVLLVFGVASLLLAALYLLEQQDLKRMLAYSSVEHMGILAIGVGFGAPLALTGVMLHVLAHAAAKGNAFMGAGVLVRKYGTREMAHIRAVVTQLPWSGPLFAAGLLALCAMPPFGLFRSEFQIVVGGLGAARTAVGSILVVLVTMAFLGLIAAGTRMLFQPAADGAGQLAAPGEPSGWMVLPVLAGIAVLVLLGVHPPQPLVELIAHSAAQLQGGSA